MRQHCCSLSGHLLDIVRQYFAYGLKPIFTLPADCEYSLFGSRPWVFIADSLDKLLSASGERACGHTRVASEPAASRDETSSCSFSTTSSFSGVKTRLLVNFCKRSRACFAVEGKLSLQRIGLRLNYKNFLWN